MTRKPTIRDVAREAGVSIKTVSRVTNEDGGVAVETEERVRLAIEQLGYRANPFARSLRTGSDEAVGLVVESIRDPFFAAVADSVEKAARAAGMVVVIASAGDTAEQERAVVSELLERSLRGLLLVPCRLDYRHEPFRLGPRGVPVVFLDRPGNPETTDCVTIDNFTAAKFATTHLIEHGHRRIGFIGAHISDYPLSDRVAGYSQALRDASLPVDEDLIAALATLPELDASVDADLERLLSDSDPITAILTGNALASLGVVKALRNLKRTDIAMVAFDDFPMADSLNPPVTVTRQDPVMMGQRAFELLMERVAGEDGPGRRVILPTSFVARGSGEMLAPQPSSSDRSRNGRPRASKATVGSK